MTPLNLDVYWSDAVDRISSADSIMEGEILSEFDTDSLDEIKTRILTTNTQGKMTISWDALAEYASAVGFITRYPKENPDRVEIFRFDNDTGYYRRSSEEELCMILNRTIKSYLNIVVPVSFEKLVRFNVIPMLMSESDLVSFEEARSFEFMYKDGEIIPFKNGLYSIRYNKLLPRTSKFVFENLLNVDFSPDNLVHAISERYLDIMCRDTDLLYDFLEQIGYIFYARTFTNPTFTIFSGAEGRNGKSTVINVIEKIIGKRNISHMSMYDMSDKFVLASSAGKFLNISADSSSGLKDKRFASSDVKEFLKKSTEGEMYTFNPKHVKPFDGYGPRKFIFASNISLNFGGSDMGLERRLRVIPFRNQFKEDRGINALFEDKDAMGWLAMNALAAFLCFVHRGAVATGTDEFRPNAPLTGMYRESKASKSAKNEQMTSQNSILNWLSEDLLCDTNDKSEVARTLHNQEQLYFDYEDFCKRSGDYSVKLQTFNRELKTRYSIESKRVGDCNNRRYRYTCTDAMLLMGYESEE